MSENSTADPAAIFGCAVSLRDAAMPLSDAGHFTLSDAYSGWNSFLQDVMRLATLFEVWATAHVAFELAVDFSTRLTSYQKELGPNAYAVFNTMTDIAARPPDSTYFQKDRDTLEKRSGRWLKELAKQSQTTDFDLNAWISEWEGDSKGRQVPGRN
jgi:hypothetical protein